MNPELDKKLCEDFPVLYKDRHCKASQSCFAFGFECGDGWEPLIRELSEKLTTLDEEIVVTQVKEKFGMLRFYINKYTDKTRELIDAVEKKSAVTCEICGAPGKTIGGSWLKTVCEKCK